MHLQVFVASKHYGKHKDYNKARKSKVSQISVVGEIFCGLPKKQNVSQTLNTEIDPNGAAVHVCIQNRRTLR